MKSVALNAMIAAFCLTLTATAAFAAEGATYTTSVNSYLQQVIAPADAAKLAGTSAVITIAYDKQGEFDQAAVAGAGDISFARKLHQSVNWKEFPKNGSNETTIVVAVNGAGSFDVKVR